MLGPSKKKKKKKKKKSRCTNTSKQKKKKKKKKRLDIKKEDEVPVQCLGTGELELHGMHHMRVDRTLYLVQKVDPLVTREKVQSVVRNCMN